jgi:hypothetical protein
MLTFGKHINKVTAPVLHVNCSAETVEICELQVSNRIPFNTAIFTGLYLRLPKTLFLHNTGLLNPFLHIMQHAVDSYDYHNTYIVKLADLKCI